MTSTIGKAALVLAASELRESDLRRLGRWIDQRGVDAFLEEIQSIRNFVDDGNANRNQVLSSSGPESTARRISKETRAKIEKLLFDEAHITRGAAADLIKAYVYNENLIKYDIPDLNRMGFWAWLEKVSESIPESELLHIVTRIRNERVHNAPSDWPLLRRGED